jgi:hypothetical protein
VSIAGNVAFAVAERVARTGGPRAGLVAYKKLAQTTADAEVRGKAILAAFRCSLSLRDNTPAAELTALWATVDQGVWSGSINALCKDLIRARWLPEAVSLSLSETNRHRTAHALYRYARCLDVARAANAVSDASAGSPPLIHAFREAIARAAKEGARDIGVASRVRLAAILSRSWSTMREAVEEARRVELAEATPAQRVVIARVLLHAPSRFVRAGAIGILDGVAKGEDLELARGALAVAARWLDELDELPTPLETDRLLALFAGNPKAREAVRSLEALAKAGDIVAALEPSLRAPAQRANDILRGRFEAVRDRAELPRDRHSWHADVLDVLVALRDAAPARAARSLRLLIDGAQAGESLSRAALGVAQLALVHDDEELRSLATRLFAIHLERAGVAAPPGGFIALADALRDNAELSLAARRAAVARGEPHAAASLGKLLARRGWDLAKEGDRDGAIAKLREAKALLAT